MWLFILLAVILVGLTHWFLNGAYGYWRKRGVPSPPTKPWVGNLGPSIILTKSLGQIYTDMYNNYKGYQYIGFYKFRKPGLLIRDVELIKNLTIKDFSSFHDNDIEGDEELDPIFGKNPFVLKGKRWKVVRSQVTAAITTGKIKNMFNIMVNVVILVGLTHWFLNGAYGYWKKRGVPSPPTKPWVGNLGPSIILTKSLGQIYTDMYNNYKGYQYIGYYKIQQPGLLIRDVELIKNVIMKDFSSFHDNDVEGVEGLDPIFERNPFVLKGKRWKVVRSQVTAAITTGKIKNMFNIMVNVGKNLANMNSRILT
ncbi:Cytochrome P450 28a5 [Carabus blaptoides fortunei]